MYGHSYMCFTDFLFILGLLRHQLSTPTPFMPLLPPHPAPNELPPHQHANQHANQHQQTMSQQKRVAYSYPFMFWVCFTTLTPSFNTQNTCMVTHTCILLIFLYFRFAQVSTKHTNPIHAHTTTTSSSEWAAISPVCKSALVNHEPMKRVAYATLFCFNACTNNLFVHAFLNFILILTSSYCYNFELLLDSSLYSCLVLGKLSMVYSRYTRF